MNEVTFWYKTIYNVNLIYTVNTLKNLIKYYNKVYFTFTTDRKVIWNVPMAKPIKTFCEMVKGSYIEFLDRGNLN